MTYLSCNKSPLENFYILANNIAVVTEEYETILKEIDHQEFPAKMKALKITAIALAALGILVAITVGYVPAIFLGSMAIFPLIGIQYQSDRNSLLLSQLQQRGYDISIIFDNIIGFLQKNQSDKEDVIITLFNQNNAPQFYGSDEQEKAENQLKDYTDRFNAGKIQFNNSQIQEEYTKFLQLIPHVQSILDRKAPPHLPVEEWEKLRKACFIFLYGQGSITPFFHGMERVSKFEPYVKLKKDENDSFRWKAMKY